MSKKTIEDYLDSADEEAESANYTVLAGLSWVLFGELKDLVDEQHHLTLAKNISKTIIAQI